MVSSIHPSPHSLQQLRRSLAESVTFFVWFDAIQILSDIASTAPNAQHDPNCTKWIKYHFLFARFKKSFRGKKSWFDKLHHKRTDPECFELNNREATDLEHQMILEYRCWHNFLQQLRTLLFSSCLIFWLQKNDVIHLLLMMQSAYLI